MRKITIRAKCSDMFDATLEQNGIRKEYNGYVPSFMGGGEYVELEIDIDTGQILNWTVPTDEDLAEIFDLADDS
jgi:hypothetical protein